MTPRPHALPALLLLATTWTAAARAQDAPPCAARIDVAAETPARVAARLRALARALPVGDADGCRAPHVHVTWSPQRLTVEVALEDGRIANRTLRSVEDVLPTLLAVLSAPPEAPALPEAPAPDVADLPPPQQPDPEEPPFAMEPAVRLHPVDPPPELHRWHLAVDASAGLTTPVVAGSALRVFTAEAGMASPRLRLVLRGSFGFHDAGGHDLLDDHGSTSAGSTQATQLPRYYIDLKQFVASAAARYRAPLGRFFLEAGGSVGVAWSHAYSPTDLSVDAFFALRLGLEAAVVLPLPWGTEVFVRGEFYTDLTPHSPPATLETATLAASMSLGLGWGAPR